MDIKNFKDEIFKAYALLSKKDKETFTIYDILLELLGKDKYNALIEALEKFKRIQWGLIDELEHKEQATKDFEKIFSFNTNDKEELQHFLITSNRLSAELETILLDKQYREARGILQRSQDYDKLGDVIAKIQELQNDKANIVKAVDDFLDGTTEPLKTSNSQICEM